MKVRKITFLMALLLMVATAIQAQKEIHLFEGVPPGSESWDWEEQNLGGGYLRDVVNPTITVYKAEKPNGIGMIVAPGGSYHFLVSGGEGSEVAKRLNEYGITAFVLKYRLVHEDPAHPYLMQMLGDKNWALLDSVSLPVMPLEAMDGRVAIKYIRDHAEELGVNPHKIGFMGSSAGATVALNVACSATIAEECPNFIASFYAYTSVLAPCNHVPTLFKCPLFMSACIDDELVPVWHSLDTYQKWLKAGQMAELHIFSEGNHSFVEQQRPGLPVNNWFERMMEWVMCYFGK